MQAEIKMAWFALIGDEMRAAEVLLVTYLKLLELHSIFSGLGPLFFRSLWKWTPSLHS